MYNLRKKVKGGRASSEDYDELVNDDVSFGSRKRKAEVLALAAEADDESSCSSDSTKADSTNGSDDMLHDIDAEDSPIKRRKLTSSPSPLSASDWVVAAALADTDQEPVVHAAVGAVVPSAEEVAKIQLLEQDKAKLERELMLERELRAKLLASLYVRTKEILVEENTYDYLDKQIRMLTTTSVKLQKENTELRQTIASLKADNEEARKRVPPTLGGHVITAEAQLELEKHKKALEVAILYQQHQAMLAYAAQQQAQTLLMQHLNGAEAAAPVGAATVPGFHPSFVAAMQQMQQSKQLPATAAN